MVAFAHIRIGFVLQFISISRTRIAACLAVRTPKPNTPCCAQ
jgi:hypothetical protein